jgi:hypothetical protein
VVNAETDRLEQESKISRHDGGCFYCGSQGQFTVEHVVCAGLGGDDRAWVLKDCVCGTCNTDIFSKLETKFLRGSPVALARLFLQPWTRDKTSVPSVQPKASYVAEPTTGVLLEAELGAGGSSVILPQLVIVDAQQAAVTGPDAASVAAFLLDLQKALSDEVTLIEKTKQGFEFIYETTPLSWKDGGYAVGESGTTSHAPKAGIWIEPLIRPVTAQDGAPLLPRIFRRPAGQLVCRVDVAEHAGLFLTVLRNAPELMDASKVGSAGTTEGKPGFHQRYNMDMAAYDRVLTKIGLNLVAKLLGLDLIRKPAFDAAVDYARNGVGGISKLSPACLLPLTNMLGSALPDRHVLTLLSVPRPNGGHALVFMARFYGGLADAVLLAEFEAPISGLEKPILLLVDYVHNKIERPTLEDAV